MRMPTTLRYSRVSNTLPINRGVKHQTGNFQNNRVSVKSCPVGPELQPSFDASSPPGCCPQNHEILLNQGMKYWDSGLNAPECTRTFIATVHIAAVLGWKRSRKEGQGKLSLAPNLLLNWISCPVEAQCTSFSCFLKSRPLCDQTGPNRGFPCRLCLTLRMTLLARVLQGLRPIPQTTAWKQLNAIKSSFACHFNKNATREVVPQLLPMTGGFTKDIFRTPQITARPWSRLLLYKGHLFARKWMAHVRMAKP